MFIRKVILVALGLSLTIAVIASARDEAGSWFGTSGNYYFRSSSYLRTHYLDQNGVWRRMPTFGMNAKSAPSEIDGEYANVDMLFGTLFFSTTDFSLRGRNGLDLRISRVYNSTVQTVGSSTNPNTIIFGTTTNKEYFGAGWHWGFERILGDTMYYANGGSEVLFRDNAIAERKKNRRFEVIRINDTDEPDTLFRPDGTRVIFDNYLVWSNTARTNTYGGKQVAKIVDPCDNIDSISHYSDSPLIESITDPGGRTIWFEYSSTDTVDLLTSRLQKLKYLGHDGDTVSIRYKYDEDMIDTLYSGNPLRIAIYPDGDTVKYAYTNSAFWEGDSSMHSTGGYSYRLKEIMLPLGGIYAYDWGIYRERDTTLTARYKWHVNVKEIRRISADSSVIDTFLFDYKYPDDRSSDTRVTSSITFPDNSYRFYKHTRILPVPVDDEGQNSGLLERIAYFSDPDTTTANSLVYDWQAGRWETNDWYWAYNTYGIGVDPATSDSVRIPILQYYYELWGRSPAYFFQCSLLTFNVNTGTFVTRVTDNGTSHGHRTYTSSTNRAVLDSTVTINIDTLEARNFWNTTKMKIDSVKVISKGETRLSRFQYDSYGNDTLVVRPLSDSTFIEYNSTYNHCYPTKQSNYYGFLWKRDYYLNTGQVSKEVSANNDTTIYEYYSDSVYYGRLKSIKKPLESAYSLIRTYDRDNETVFDSLKIGATKYQLKKLFYDGFNRLIKTKLYDDGLDSIITRREFDFADRVRRSTRAYTSLSDTAWTTFAYDILDRTLRTDYPDGTDDSTYFDSDTSSSAALTTEKIDPLGRKTTNISNNKKELAKVKSNTTGRDSVLYEYTAFSRMSKMTDPRGLQTKYWYDDFGNVSKDSTGDEGVRQYYNDSRNRLRFIQNAASDWSYIKYDLMGRMIETGIAGSIHTDSVDISGYPSSGHTVQVTYKYDDYSSGFAPSDSTEDNPEFNLTEIDDESGRYWFYYDDRGRPVHKMVQLDGLSDTLHIFLTYGNADQITKITYPDSTEVTYDYYRSLMIKDIPGYVDHPYFLAVGGFEYEPWGAVKKMILEDTTFTITFDYNSMSFPTKIFARKDTLGIWGRSYGYDNAQMITLVKELDNSGNPTNDTTRVYDYDYIYRLIGADIMPGSDEIGFGYDKSGNRIFKKLNADSTVYFYSYGPDTLEMVVDGVGDSIIATIQPSIADSSVGWSFTPSGVRTRGDFKIWSAESTYVDLINQTTQTSGSFTPISILPLNVKLKQTGGSDPDCGIVANVSYFGGNQGNSNSNRLLSLSGQGLYNYEYNENGSVVYDTSKNIEYFFDEANRLDSVLVGNYKRYVYYYDAGGKRVKKLYIEGIYCDSTEWSVDDHNDHCEHALPTCAYTPGDVDGIGGGCTMSDVIYLSDYYRGEGPPPPYPIFRGDTDCDGDIDLGDVIYAIACYRGEVSAKCCYWIYTDTTATYYVYSGNQVLAEYDESGNLLDNYVYGNGLNPIAKNNPTDGKRFYMRDIRGSVVVVTDSTGSSVTSYDYYPFGGGLTVGGSHDRYRYTHKEFEDGYEVNVYYYGARYMDPALGRFISPDPIREYYNPYSYVANNPIYFTDPNGRKREPESKIFKVFNKASFLWDILFNAASTNDGHDEELAMMRQVRDDYDEWRRQWYMESIEAYADLLGIDDVESIIPLDCDYQCLFEIQLQLMDIILEAHLREDPPEDEGKLPSGGLDSGSDNSGGTLAADPTDRFDASKGIPPGGFR